MFHYLVKEDEFLPAKEVDSEGIDALNSGLRRKILEIASEQRVTVNDISDELDADRQTVYYNLEKLENAGLLEAEGKRPRYFSSENAAYYYRPSHVEPEENPLVLGEVPEIFHGFIEERRIKARVVVGAPYPHGETNRMHRNGYRAGEVAAVLGNYGSMSQQLVHTDKQLERDDSLRDHPLISIGGFRVNTFSEDIYRKMPIRFEESGERIMLEDGTSFTGGEKGFVARTEIDGNLRMLVAGISGIGSSAAIHALHQIPERLGEGAVVEGFGTKESMERVDVLETL